MNGVDTSEALTGLVMFLIWTAWLWTATYNPLWYLTFGLALYSVWVGSYINDLGTRYKVPEMVKARRKK